MMSNDGRTMFQPDAYPIRTDSRLHQTHAPTPSHHALTPISACPQERAHVKHPPCHPFWRSSSRCFNVVVAESVRFSYGIGYGGALVRWFGGSKCGLSLVLHGPAVGAARSSRRARPTEMKALNERRWVLNAIVDTTIAPAMSMAIQTSSSNRLWPSLWSGWSLGGPSIWTAVAGPLFRACAATT